MAYAKSVINTLPIAGLNQALDSLGIEKTWYSLLATNLKHKNRSDLNYILQEKEFKNIPLQDFDFINNLTVGEISALYEYSLAYTDRDKRKLEGQYFTPDDVAMVMAEKSLTFAQNKIWLDPCSGVGNLSFWLTKCQKNSESFLQNNLYLLDKDKLALFIARFIFAVNFQQKDPALFKNIKNRFIEADFLFSNNLPDYDFAILNPPYVVVSPDNHFATSEARDLYAYFLERVITSSKGFISITPQTFTNGQKFRSLRKLLLDNFNKLDIYCFDNVPDNIFKGVKFGSKNTNKANSTRAGIIIAKKDKTKERAFRITPLLRWRSFERQQLLRSIDNYLVKIQPGENIFPKLQEALLPLYQYAKGQSQTLAHMLSPRPTAYKLVVPSTPRYFISALKRQVQRSSSKNLYFYTAKERDIAYLLLNSSYMYWWWRVNDGGMTISEKTLLTLPIIKEIKVDSGLLLAIETSEKNNIVVKKNAGKDNENVKHSPSLLGALNRHLFPRFAKALEVLHRNSVIC